MTGLPYYGRLPWMMAFAITNATVLAADRMVRQVIKGTASRMAANPDLPKNGISA
jgi:hypothetical protein